MELIHKIYIACLVLYSLFYICLILYLYFNFSKPYDDKSLKRFNKEVPEKLNPIELSILVYKKVVPQVYLATVIYLIQIKALLKTKEKGNIYLSVNKNFEGKLSHSQKYILDLLTNIIGTSGKVSFKEINEYCDDSGGASTFLINYEIWKRLAIKEGSKKQFFIPKTKYNVVLWTRNIGLVLFALNILLKVNSHLGYFIIIPAIFIMIYFSKIYKRTKKYNKEFYLWLEYGNYLKHIKELGHDKDKTNMIIIYSIILDKFEYVEPLLLKNNDFSTLNNYLLKCYTKSFFKGSRKIFK